MRYGYWLPVFGGWLRNVDDENMAATWEYSKKLAQRSEHIGTQGVVCLVSLHLALESGATVGDLLCGVCEPAGGDQTRAANDKHEGQANQAHRDELALDSEFDVHEISLWEGRQPGALQKRIEAPTPQAKSGDSRVMPRCSERSSWNASLTRYVRPVSSVTTEPPFRLEASC